MPQTHREARRRQDTLAGEPGPVDELEPLYLRVPDAERNLR